ncbi:MAG: CCA tRNA nucleotidyltransferase [Clostridiaceae bacterium]
MDITNSFDEKQKAVIAQITEVCRKNKIKAYLVGGAVRDAVLKIPPRDIDLCLEEDPKKLLPEFQTEGFIYHEPFQTAAVKFKNGVSIDFIRCRKEIYDKNGALPTVIPSDIYDDLKRRDFTVNALAYDISSGSIIDPFGGMRDIQEHVIRSVHGNSYREDPTRIFRAAKYASRYGFEISDIEEVKNCLKEGVFSTISNERYFNEVLSLCSEVGWIKAVLCCRDSGIFDLEEDALGKISPFADYSDINVRLLNLSYCLKNIDIISRISDNSNVEANVKKALKNFVEVGRHKLLPDAMDNYDIYSVLRSSNRYERILLSFDSSLIYKLLNFENNLGCKLKIDGEYIKKAGISEGKTVGIILEYLTKLKLNMGLIDEKKYFDENLGEILDAIKYKA